MTGRLDASANTYSVGGLGGPPRRRASVPICPGAPAVQALRSSSVLSQASSGRRPRAGPHRDACPLDGRRSALAAEASGGPGLGVSFWLAAQAQCCHMCGPPCTVVRCRAMQVLECSMSDRAEKRRLHARADSYYEYLLKTWLLRDRRVRRCPGLPQPAGLPGWWSTGSGDWRGGVQGGPTDHDELLPRRTTRTTRGLVMCYVWEAVSPFS